MLSVRVDTRGLERKIKAFRGIGKALAKATADIATEAFKQLDATYGRRANPYGQPWRPRQRSYPWPLLEKSGATRGSLAVRPTSRSIHMEVGGNYIWHQNGTRYLPVRLILPTRGLPAKMRAAFVKIIKRHMREALRG